MNPEEIQGREFPVGLRGYDTLEVQAFLAEVALEHEALQREIDELRSRADAAGAPGEALDDFESLGSSVAAVLRAAKESAADITASADRAASQVRTEAEHYAGALRQQAEETLAAANESAETLRLRVASETEELRRAATIALADARSEAERIAREANEKATALAIEVEARVRNETDAMVAEAEARVAEAAARVAPAEARVAEARRREHALLERLRESADELALAILALSDEDDTVEGEGSDSGDAHGRDERTSAEDHAWS